MRITRKKSIELLTFLSCKLNEYVDSEDLSINHGGCGVFAEKLYNMLVDIGLKPKIALVTRFDRDFVQTELKNKDEKNNVSIHNVPFTHIMVWVNGYLIDSNGIYKNLGETEDYSNHKLVFGTTIDVIRYWNKQVDGWNRRFNRKVAIPKIRISLKKVKKDLEIQINSLSL